MRAAIRQPFWSVLVLVTCVAGWACGPQEDAGSPGGEPASPAGESTPVAEPPVGGVPRPGPVRRPSPSVEGPQARVDSQVKAVRYFAHARFSLARDEQGRPLGVRVDSVLANGKVYWAGVHEEDLLTRINHVRLDDPRTFEQAVRLVEDQFLAGRPQRIHIIRQGKAAALVPMGAIKTEPVPETEPVPQTQP
ncbi:MAG: hypothetical protein O7F11_04335 [Acidobacteria bacterium]|nr:hypothetical protein [Acidobacteriota bacterium]